MAHVDKRDPKRCALVNPVRVGLDLDGSLESLRNSMTELADELRTRGDCSLVGFRSRTAARNTEERSLRGRRLFAPLWERGRGPSIDRQLRDVEVIHLAGVAIPPVRAIPLILSVDDLRPLRDDARSHHRAVDLRRCVDRGARIVVSSRSASHEVQEVLQLDRTQFTVVRPPVGSIAPTVDGRRLVVQVTGQGQQFLSLAPQLVAFCAAQHCDLVVIGSAHFAGVLRTAGVNATFLHRANATEALRHARLVVSLSDGARFPAFAVAALAAGVPTLASLTPINRELLSGAATLLESDGELVDAIDDMWTNEAHRSIARAAGFDRAGDFAPHAVAATYASLYAEVARGVQ